MRWIVVVLVLIGGIHIAAAQSNWHFAYVAPSEAGFTLTLVNPADGQIRDYPLPNAGSWLSYASVNTAGTDILFWFNNYPRDDSQASVIRHLNLQTGELRDIIDLSYFHDDWGTAVDFDFFPFWSPDSRYVLHIDNLYDFTSQKLYTLPQEPLARAWSADSQRLIIGQPKCEGDYCRGIEVKLFQLPDMTLLQTASTTDWHELCDFKWSPDETIVVFDVHCSYLGSGLFAYGELMVWDLATNTLSPLTDYTTSPQEYYEQIGATRDGHVSYSAQWLTDDTLITSVKHADWIMGEDGYVVDPPTFVVETVLHTFPANQTTRINNEWVDEWALNPVTQQVAYQTRRIILTDAHDTADEAARIEIATFNGTTLVVEQQLAAGCELSWSPDGAWLAFKGLVDIMLNNEDCGNELHFAAANSADAPPPITLPENTVLAGWIQPMQAAELFFPAGTPTPVPTFSGAG